MTPEAQRIAIAEAYGYVAIGNSWWQVPGRETQVALLGLPDYCNDLNAMAEAEAQVITGLQIETFVKHLMVITDHEHPKDDWGLCEWCLWYVLRATAAQRAEAFLRTLGRWQETNPKEPHGD